MKSKLFKQHQKEKVTTAQNQAGAASGAAQNGADSSDLEVKDTSVASAKGSKLMVIVASAVLITLVIYFIFFKGQQTSRPENLEEVTETPITEPVAPTAGKPAAPDKIEDLLGQTNDTKEPDILEKPALPDIPKLPEIPKDISFNESVLPNFLDVPEENKPTDIQSGQKNPANPAPGNGQQTGGQQQPAPEPEKPRDPRRSEIVVESSGAVDSSNFDDDRFAGGIIPLKQDDIDSLKETKASVVPTLVKDRTTTIAQGKMMTAVLETAINTEFPGSVRGIISRDVYAESGSNVLIPRGSRLYGSYSTQVVRGQGRVEITWSRLIRPDGVDLKVGFVASDQFGRSGIEGDIDNKYGSIITNSLLTSVLAVGGAIAAEKLSGSGDTTTTTSPSTGTTTTTSKPSAQVITDVTKTLIDTVGKVVGNAIDTRPVIRIPQGTRITIVVNADMSIPKLREDKNK